MKVNTVEQFKVLEFIKKNFEMDFITINILDNISLEVTDQQGGSLIFYYEDGKIKEKQI